MNHRIKIEMRLAKAKTAADRAENLRESSRALREASKALVQQAKRRAMYGEIILPKKPPKRGA